jgi:hypothetical protein
MKYTKKRHSKKRQNGGGIFGFRKPKEQVRTNYSTATVSVPQSVNTSKLVQNNWFGLLGYLAGKRVVDFNPTTGTIVPQISPEIFVRYESILAQCAFLSRLAYASTGTFIQAVKEGMELMPKDKNNLVSKLERTRYKTVSNGYNDDFIPNDMMANGPGKVLLGKYFPISGCVIYTYHNSASKINNKKSVFVTFKGSSSARDWAGDFNAYPMALKDTGYFPDQGGAIHAGFFRHFRKELKNIIQTTAALCSDAEELFITGHSLGGAMASLYMLFLEGSGKVTIPKHLITFGAPPMLGDETRNFWNQTVLVNNPKNTLDRVAARNDFVTNIVPGMSHPGVRPSKLDEIGTSRAVTHGQTSDIGKLRSIVSGIPSSGNEMLSDEMLASVNIRQPQIVPPLSPEEETEQKQGVKDLQSSAEAVQTQNAGAPPGGDAADDVEEVVVTQRKSGFMNTLKRGAATLKNTVLRKHKTIYLELSRKSMATSVYYNCQTVEMCHLGYMHITFRGGARLPGRKEPEDVTEIYDNGIVCVGKIVNRETVPGQLSAACQMKKSTPANAVKNLGASAAAANAVKNLGAPFAAANTVKNWGAAAAAAGGKRKRTNKAKRVKRRKSMRRRVMRGGYERFTTLQPEDLIYGDKYKITLREPPRDPFIYPPPIYFAGEKEISDSEIHYMFSLSPRVIQPLFKAFTNQDFQQHHVIIESMDPGPTQGTNNS